MLVGMILLGVPVAAHLTGYREVRAVDFPTLRFLRASQIKVRRRTRIESLLLLLLRLVAVAAIVALFARPSFTWTAPAIAGFDPARTSVILLDRSASMGAGSDRTVFDAAMEEARELLAGLSVGTPVGVIAFDGRASVLGPGLTEGRDGLQSALNDVTLGFERTNLDRALRRARDMLRDARIDEANLFILSDGTATEPPLGLAADWPAGLKVHYHDLSRERPSNRFPVSVKVETGARRGEGLRVEATFRAVGALPSGPIPVTLRLGDGLEVVGDVTFKDDGSGARSFSLPVPPAGRVTAELVMPGDDLSTDDRFPFLLQGDSDLEVLLVSGDGGAHPRDDEVYFLAKALQPGPGSLSRIRPRVVHAEELRRLDGGRGDVVFLCNVADPRALAPELEAFVRRGGGLFISVGNRVDPDQYNEALGALLPAMLTEVKTRGKDTFEQSPTGLGLPPFNQEEFQVFRMGGAGVFAKARFGRMIGTEPRLQDDAKVLLRFTDGLPAMLDRRVGDGRVVLFTSSIDTDWTDLPVRSIFVPLVHQFARSLTGTLLLDGLRTVDVGASVSLPVPPNPDEDAWVERPDGLRAELDRGAADADGRVRFSATDLPGHYRLFWGAGGSRAEGILRLLFAARVSEAESKLLSLDRDELLAAIPGLVLHDGGSILSGEDRAEVVRTTRLGPWVLGLLGLMMLGESTLAGRRA
jgi:hypothetical protein